MKQNRKQLKFVMLLIAAVTLVAVWQLSQQRQLNEQEVAAKLEITTLDGEQITLGAPDQPVRLLFFWSTSCAVCLEELPEWVRLHGKYTDSGLEILAMAMPYDPPSHLLRVKQDFVLPYAIGLDMNGEVKNAFNVLGTPTTILVSKDNQLLYRQSGRTNFTALGHRIEHILSQQKEETG